MPYIPSALPQQYAPPPQDSLADFDQLAHLYRLFSVEFPTQGRVGQLACLGAAPVEGRDVLLVPGIGEGAAQLGK